MKKIFKIIGLGLFIFLIYFGHTTNPKLDLISGFGNCAKGLGENFNFKEGNKLTINPIFTSNFVAMILVILCFNSDILKLSITAFEED